MKSKIKEPLFGYSDLSIQSKIIHGEALKELKKIDDNKFDLVITSPPYNVGKEYEVKISIEKYLEKQTPIIEQLVRVLSKNGSICWQVGNYVEKSEIFPLDIFYYEIFKRFNLKLRNRIIWHFGHGLHASKRLSGRYETILWFTKSDEYIFNLDNIRVPSKYPGKRYFKGPKKGQISGNPKGKNPSDIWEIIAQDWDNLLWDIPNVKSNHPEKTIHQCQFPIELVERCVLALTNKGSWVLDPFAGVGSTLIAALKNDRNSIGLEKEERYCQVAHDRIESFKKGSLKIRPINKPIHQPSRNDKVAQIPLEWLSIGSV